MKFLCDFLAHTLNAAHCLAIEFLWRELYGGVARVDTGKLYVFGNGIGYDFAIFCHCVHLHFLCVFDKLAYHHRVVFAHIGCQTQKFLKLFLVGAYVHGSTGEHVGRSHENREANFVDKLVDVVHGGKGTPRRLVDAVAREHRRELCSVFGVIDILCRCAEYGHVLCIETHGKVVGYLSTGGDNHSVGVFEFDDVHDTFEGELVEIEAVAHVVVGGHCLGVVIYHYRAVAFLSDGVKGLYSTPVELYR